MIASQLSECMQIADLVVVYVDLNSDSSSIIINNNWVPIPDQNTNVLDIIKTYKENQVMNIYGNPEMIIRPKGFIQKGDEAQRIFTNSNSNKPLSDNNVNIIQ